MPYRVPQLSPVEPSGVFLYGMDFGKVCRHRPDLSLITTVEQFFFCEVPKVTEIIISAGLLHKQIILSCAAYRLDCPVAHLSQHIDCIYMTRQVLIFLEIEKEYRSAVRGIIMPEPFGK